MQQEPFRLAPAMPAGAYKTYAVAAPPATHWRNATCAEVDCAAHQNGWASIIDESTDLGKAQAYHIRRVAGRAYTEERDEAGLTVFSFPAGERCFREHKVPLERPALYLVGNGDHRMFDARRAYRHSSPEDWRDDFGEHQERLRDQIERG